MNPEINTGIMTDTVAAGAFDYIDMESGLLGWLLMPVGFARVPWVGAFCEGVELARSVAALPRPDIDGVVGRETDCKFLIGWSRFSRETVEKLAALSPNSVVSIRSLDLDMQIRNVGITITIADIDHILRNRKLKDRISSYGILNNYIDIYNSGTFDENFYLARYDIHQDRIADPLLHYLKIGEARGYQPNRFFDPQVFRASARLNATAGALAAYLARSTPPYLSIGPDFDEAGVRRTMPAGSQEHPLAHALRDAEAAEAAALDKITAQIVAQTAAPAPLLGESPAEVLAVHGMPAGHTAPAATTGGAAPVADQPRPVVTPTDGPPGLLAFDLRASGLFDADYYVTNYPDILQSELSPLEHFVSFGDREGRNPNPYFDSVWYAKKYFKAAPAEGAFLHFLTSGEKAGLKPCPVFDPQWYAETYKLDLQRQSALGHYLLNRHTNAYCPNAYFSIEDYLDRYPDIREANIDAFHHWHQWGIHENRKASDLFDAEFVWRRYLGNNRSRNAFDVFMDTGLEFGWEGALSASTVTIHREIKANTAPGPYYEDLNLPEGEVLDLKAKAIAFYLPQFHAIPENDAWWGTGFTEWRNLVRGVPRFRGHYQPRVPRDLGFYTLQGTEVMRQQVDLARKAGLHGFCFYYYNFNGHRLLEKPLDDFVADPAIDFPFCLLWANENWTRRWDGMDKDVLMSQDYRHEDINALIDDFARYMKHPNYIRVNGRPFLGLYRADIVPDCEQTIKEWRRLFQERHGLNPLIVMCQTFNCNDPRPFGFDAALEFPPHKLGSTLPLINSDLEMMDPDFRGNISDYADIIDVARQDIPKEYPLLKTAFPSWDNDARKQGSGLCFHNSTPALFEKWMKVLVDNARENPVLGESLVFVNAWNEWCEGAYLEPDCHFGYAYLNAMSRALMGEKPAALAANAGKVLLVGHDGFKSGAQQLLLNIGRTLKRQFGLEIEFILMGDGDMVRDYAEVAPTYVMPSTDERWNELWRHMEGRRAAGFRQAITNSIFSGAAAKMLREQGFEVCSLVHELPTIIEETNGQGFYQAVREHASTVVYPNQFVKSELDRAFGPAQGKTVVRSQGIYKNVQYDPAAAEAVRRELGLGPDDRIVINVGYADIRKGVDLFVAIGEQIARTEDDVHLVWVGDQHPKVMPWIKRDLERRKISNIHFVPFNDAISRYISAADLFFLSSREDPFPSVVLEALSCTIPVMSFDWGGGYVELLRDRKLGGTTPYLDIETAAKSILASLNDRKQNNPIRRSYRQKVVSEKYDFRAYCADLVRYVDTRYRTISVIVPNYNYANYLSDRLASIFSQTYPVFEIIVLDDASTDQSLKTARSVADRWRRTIRIEPGQTNSGNVFRQWKRGLDMARGEFVWIAEADDLSDPTFLARMVEAMSSSTSSAFAYCDSVAIDADGARMYDSYKGYYSILGDHGLDQDGRFDTREFMRRFLAPRNLVLNASAVLWRRAHLAQAFTNLGEDAFRLSCAGDWRVYIEACRLEGEVHYLADCLNMHRRHDSSVTHALAKPAHFDEIVEVQEVVLGNFPADEELREAVEKVREELNAAWSLAAAEEVVQ